MDPDSAGCGAGCAGSAGAAGTFISLSEREQRFYSALHGRCQADSSGTLSSSRVAELLQASGLPQETLHKVTEVCGAKRLGYFGTPQFFVALKLLAAAQSAKPVSLESLSASLPLPRFVGLKNEAELRYVTPGAEFGPAPRPPTDRITFRHPETTVDQQDSWSPPRSPSSSPPRFADLRNGSDVPHAYEGQPRSAVQPGNHGNQAGNHGNQSGLDQQGLDHEEDPWRITEEQLDYYTLQFKTLQPDLGALVHGTIAKNFFTKSKLPIPELSHIWELSDVDRDGALTFSEFCTAFHLIVARKNGYVLPENLPPSLRPGAPQPGAQGPPTPESVEALIVFEDTDSVVERLQAPKKDGKEETGSKDVTRSSMSRDKRTLQLGAFTDRQEHQDLDPHLRTRTRPRSYSSTSIEDAMKKGEEPPTPPPRPQKTHSRASSLDLNKLFQQGAPGLKSGWMPPPPALPPRPTPAQVQVPQKKVQQLNFADFSHFREEEEVKPEDQSLRSRFGSSNEDQTNPPKQEVTGVPQAPVKPVRRKYHQENPNLEATPPPFPTPTKPANKPLSKQKREIQTAIRKNKETNAVLQRLNSELQQQLKVVHQERVTLETQLDLLRPLTST